MTGEGEKFHEVARPDEKTVQKAAAGEVQPPPRRRRKARAGAIEAEVRVTTVNREVWAEAQRRAEHPSHIQIISSDEVVVWNHPAPWPGQPKGGQ